MITALPLDRAIIRPLSMEDASDLATFANNHKLWMQLQNYFPQPYWVMDAMRFLGEVSQQKPLLTYGIEVKGRCVGVISGERLRDIYKQTVALTCWLGEPYWGQGIATEVVAAFSTYLFDHLDIHRQQAGVFSTNKAAMRVLEKAGFHKEAVHQHKVMKAGHLLDEHLFVKLRP